MANHTLLWEDELEDSFELLAIHCSEEAYKLAYLLNQKTGLKLRRCSRDLDFTHGSSVVYFTVFSYHDQRNHVRFHLIQNKSYSVPEIAETEMNLTTLFSTEQKPRFLIPELKNVDFLLKIEHENEIFLLRELISDSIGIRQVVSIYSLETEFLKSKDNLIFDLC